MMYNFTLQLFFIGSASVVVYLFTRALPRVADQDEPPTVYDYFDAWLAKLPLHHVDSRLNALLFKFLKRVRVVVMKIDNYLIRHLARVQQNGKQTTESVQELFDKVQEEKTLE